jgi:hypothetical protein
MSNKVLLKKSSVLGKIPLATDLDYGELALNYADGLLYFKNSSNVVQSFSSSGVSLTGTQTLTNKTLTSPTLNTPSINGGNISVGNGTLIIPFSAAPAQTETGSLVYDSGVGTLTIGTGSGRKTFVELTASQTITNKTLTAPTITNAVFTGTITANSSTGTNGQYLQSTATGVRWNTVPTYTLPTATTSVLGGVIVGDGLLVTAGTISVDSSSFVTLNDAQTLTNKTIAAPTVTGVLNSTDTTESTSSTTGAIKTAGGIAAVKNITTGGSFNLSTFVSIQYNPITESVDFVFA